MKSLFKSQTKKNYQKRGEFLWRLAKGGETVLTIVAGKLETIKTTGDDDVIIRNLTIGSSAELYIIGRSKFESRYEISPNTFCWIEGVLWNFATAKGKIESFCYRGPTIEFIAPWGEKMLCEEGDYIARPLGGDNPNDIYRIEKNTFDLTYSEIKE